MKAVSMEPTKAQAQRSAGAGSRIRLEGVSKSFDDVEAVKPVDLVVEPAEFVTLLGPSGCGKSTTLNLIAGLESPTSGRIHFDGEDVTELSPQARNVAMVFQSYALYPHMTVAENIAFPLRRRGVGLSSDEVAERTSTMCRTLGLDALMERYPSALSGGQRQRVAVGRALVREPTVFLMDEPLSNLDNQLRVQMRTELHELHREYTITTIYVTHDQVEAMVLSDRIVVLDKGVVQQVGTPSEVYHEPANLFVARFMGERGMNILPCALNSDRSALEIAGERFPGSFNFSEEGSARTVGIWPEALRVLGESDQASLDGVIREIEDLGSDVMVQVSVAQGDHDLWISDPAGRTCSIGERISIGLNRGARLSLFDDEGVSIGTVLY